MERYTSPALPLPHDGHWVDPWRVLHGGQLHLLQTRAGQSLPLLVSLLLGRPLTGGRLLGSRGGGGGERGGIGDTDCHAL